VTLETGDPATDDAMGAVSIRVRATGGRLPVRMYLYVNGDLAEAWTESEGEFDLSLDHYGPGRHAVTARAVVALGLPGGRLLGTGARRAGLTFAPIVVDDRGGRRAPSVFSEKYRCQMEEALAAYPAPHPDLTGI
jgi:hypothetical protein